MAKLPWVKFNPSEWLSGDVQLVSLEAQALYLNICALYWKTRGKITLTMVSIRYTDAMRIVCELYSMGIIEESEPDAPLSIPWLDREMIEVAEAQEKRSNAGKKAAAVRWDAKRIADAEQSQCDDDTNKKKSKTKTREERREEPPTPDTDYLFKDC